MNNQLADCKETVRKKEAFDAWMKEVNANCSSRTGMVTMDLPDMDFWAMFEAGDSPEETVNALIEDNGFDPEDF